MRRSEDSAPDAASAKLTASRHIFNSGVWMAVSSIVPFLATAALSVVAGRVLGAQLLGEQSLIAFVGALVSAVAVTSLTDASIRHLAATRAGAPMDVASFERWTLRAHLATGCLAAAVVVVVGVVRGDHLDAWLVVAVSVVLEALAWAWSSRIISRDGWAPVARRRLLTQLLAVGLGIVAVLSGYGITGIFVSNAVATAVLLLLLRPLTPRPAPARALVLPRPVLSLWAFFVGGALLTQVTSGRIEILFLGAVASGEQIAQYTVAVMLVTSAVTLPASLAGAAMPAVAAASGAGEQRRAEDAVVRALRVSALLSLPLTAVIVATGPAFIVALYGSGFREAGELSRWMAVGALVIPCGRLATTYWSGLGQMRPPFTAGVIGATLELLLAFLLIPGLAARGAVAATLVGQCSTAMIVIALSRRALARRIVPARSWCSAAVASALAAWSGVLAASGGGLLGAVAGGVVTTVVFIALVAAVGRAGAPLLTADDGRWLRGALPARLGPLVRPLTGAP